MDFGVVLLVVGVLLFIPALLGGLAVIAVILGWASTQNAKATHADSELTALEHPEPAAR